MTFEVGQTVYLNEEGAEALELPEGTSGVVTEVIDPRTTATGYKYPVRVQWAHDDLPWPTLMQEHEVEEEA